MLERMAQERRERERREREKSAERDRKIRMLAEQTGVPYEEAKRLLQDSEL